MSNVIYCKDLGHKINKRECYHAKNDPSCQGCKHLKEKIESRNRKGTNRVDSRKNAQSPIIRAACKKEMRLNESDRLAAMERCPEYIKDREELFELYMKDGNGPVSEETSALHEKLRRKWDVQGFYLYSSYANKGEPRIETWKRPALDLVSEDEWTRVLRMVDNSYGNRPLSKIPHLVAVEKTLYVQLQIDLSRSEKELTKRFHETIKACKKQMHIPAKERKSKKTRYDPWEIYDLHEKSGLSLLEIARRLHGKNYPRGNKSPSDNPELWAPYKRVKRAYNRAVRMIQAVRNLK